MDRQIKRYLDKRGVKLSKGPPARGLLGEDGGFAAFFRWFHDDVMQFDSEKYRREFWREAYQNGHTIGHMPRTMEKFLTPDGPGGQRIFPINLAALVAVFGASAVVWCIVRVVLAHIRRLRRPTYYKAERERRRVLAAERRRILKRRTVSACPTPEALLTAFRQARASAEDALRFGSMLEDLECYVDNSVIWDGVDGRIVGRRGGIREWLRNNAPELSARYKTVMKYKALSKRFRQATGLSDPVPASAILPETSEANISGGRDAFRRDCAKRSRQEGQDDKGKTTREHCAEQSNGAGERHEPLRLKCEGKVLSGGGKPAGAAEIKPVCGCEGENSTAFGTYGDLADARERAHKLLGRCEGTFSSLAAVLALAVSEDFVPEKCIASAGAPSNGAKSG